MKRLIIILFSVTLFCGCGFSIYPEELEVFTSNISNNYWVFDIESGVTPVFSLLLSCNQNKLNAMSISLYTGNIPEQYSEFIQKTRKVVYYNYTAERKISWVKVNTEFDKPEVANTGAGVPIPDYFVDAFDCGAASIAVKKKWIKTIRKLSTAPYSNWIGYLAEYDLTGAKGIIPVSEDKGKLVFFISPDHDQLIESYHSNNQWDYIRYVEGGDLRLSINEADPESMIKTIWDTWQEYLVPYLNYLDMEL